MKPITIAQQLALRQAVAGRRCEKEMMMLKELATVAAYSASASLGRDVYRSTKDGNPLIWLGLAVFMSVAGFKIFSAGGEREGEEIASLSVVGAVFLIIGGIAVFNLFAFFIMAYTGLAAKYNGAGGLLILINLAYISISGLIGIIWGSNEKSEKERVWAIEAHNMQFLNENGFQDLGLGDEIIEDADGNRLKIKEQQDGRILFLVVGRRNVRAAIILDEEGRMMDYTGAVKL